MATQQPFSATLSVSENIIQMLFRPTLPYFYRISRLFRHLISETKCDILCASLIFCYIVSSKEIHKGQFVL